VTSSPILKVLSIFSAHGVKALLMGGQACIPERRSSAVTWVGPSMPSDRGPRGGSRLYRPGVSAYGRSPCRANPGSRRTSRRVPAVWARSSRAGTPGHSRDPRVKLPHHVRGGWRARECPHGASRCAVGRPRQVGPAFGLNRRVLHGGPWRTKNLSRGGAVFPPHSPCDAGHNLPLWRRCSLRNCDHPPVDSKAGNSTRIAGGMRAGKVANRGPQADKSMRMRNGLSPRSETTMAAVKMGRDFASGLTSKPGAISSNRQAISTPAKPPKSRTG